VIFDDGRMADVVLREQAGDHLYFETRIHYDERLGHNLSHRHFCRIETIGQNFIHDVSIRNDAVRVVVGVFLDDQTPDAVAPHEERGILHREVGQYCCNLGLHDVAGAQVIIRHWFSSVRRRVWIG
jgi:hypothetical protein